MLTSRERLQLQRFAEACRQAAGSALRAVLLVGDAAAMGSAAPAATLTTAVLVDRITTGMLGSMGTLTQAWRRRGLPAPLLLDLEQIATSCDVFPLEMLDLQDRHLLLWGDKDPFHGLVINHEHLRLEVEEQLRGKLLHLRQAYLEAHGREKDLRALLLDSSGGFELIARGMRHLAGHGRAAESATLIRDLEAQTGLSLATFRTIRSAALGGGNRITDVEATFARYHDELAALVRSTDDQLRSTDRELGSADKLLLSTDRQR